MPENCNFCYFTYKRMTVTYKMKYTSFEVNVFVQSTLNFINIFLNYFKIYNSLKGPLNSQN